MARIIGNCKIGAKLMSHVSETDRHEVLTVVGVHAFVRDKNYSRIICENKNGTRFWFFIKDINENNRYKGSNFEYALHLSKVAASPVDYKSRAKYRHIEYAIE